MLNERNFCVCRFSCCFNFFFGQMFRPPFNFRLFSKFFKIHLLICRQIEFFSNLRWKNWLKLVILFTLTRFTVVRNLKDHFLYALVT